LIGHNSTLFGLFGPISRTKLDGDAPCPRWLLSDGRGTTSGSADDAGNIQIQHFDAFGVALETAVISTCPMPNCQTCERGRRATGELGYHGQEGYRTRHYDANRAEDLPNKSPDHPEYNASYPDGYETASTGFMQVGARDYDPAIGRWLEVDPASSGPEMRWGQLNRWVYCANDPVNLSDPTGLIPPLAVIGIVITILSLVSVGIDIYQNGLTTKNIIDLILALLPSALGLCGRLLAKYGGSLIWNMVRLEHTSKPFMYADERRLLQDAVDFAKWLWQL